MSANRSVIVRMLLYSSIAAYLIGDLVLFNGPLKQKFDSTQSSPSISHSLVVGNRLVAKVSGNPITRSQLNRAVTIRLWLEGKAITDIKPTELTSLRQTALTDLIDQELLRLQANTLAPHLKVTSEEVDERMKRLQDKFLDEEALNLALQSQGIAKPHALRERILSDIRQEKYLAMRLAPLIKLNEGEAENWFEKNKESLSLPERIEVRHIFLPTLDHPSDEAKTKLEAALTKLISNPNDFALLANEISEDSATKSLGGNLGWMTRDRLPVGLDASFFALETHKPTLVQSHLGWHLVEITARKPSESRTFDQAKPEILTALESIKRRQAASEIRNSLRNTSSGKIEIFSTNME